MWSNWHPFIVFILLIFPLTEVYHDAVLTLSLITLEAYDFMCHSGAEYYICCIFVGYPTHYVFPAVNFVCQTSTVVAAVLTVAYCIVYMWHAIVSHYVLC
jgi:hypothetical protein